MSRRLQMILGSCTSLIENQYRCSALCPAPFHYAFVQRGLLEVLLLAVGAGLLGTWIVLRGLAFYSHAVGTAAFPGLVLADGLGFSAPLGAFARGARRSRSASSGSRAAGARGYDSLTALVLVGALALGVILASDVFHSGANVDSLLFGSLLLIGHARPRRSPRWRARPRSRRRLVLGPALARDRLRPAAPRARSALRSAAARRAAARRSSRSRSSPALAAIGALLATALFVVPAATVRLWTQRLRAWQVGVGRARRGRGRRRALALGRAERPAGRGDRRARRRRCSRSSPRRRARRSRASGCAGRRRGAGCSLLAGCGSSGRRPTRPDGRRDDDADRRLGARRRRRRDARVHQILQPNTDPHEYEPRPADVEATARREGRVRERRRPRRAGWARSSRAPAASRRSSISAHGAAALPGESRAEASSSTRTGGTTRATRGRGRARSATRSSRADPAHARGPIARNAAAYVAQPAGARPRASPPASRSVPPAQRKLVTDHDAFGYFARALRHHGRRRRDPVADDAGAAVRRRDRRG